MKKLTVALYLTVVASAVFSFMNLTFRADISLAAFPLALFFTALLFLFGCGALLKKQKTERLEIVRKLLQYQPFVLLVSFVLRRAGSADTSYVFDVVSVLLWTFAAVCSAAVLWLISPKRAGRTVPEWKGLVPCFRQEGHPFKDWYRSLGKKGQGRVLPFPWKRAAVEIREWADAFVQAAFTVLLINIFVLQLYEIPSESMVPEFLVGDRVAVFKTASGPRFPLAAVGIPRMRSYSRGDIVVFRNPHYSRDRKSEVQNFVSQLVYMLTFTGVNLNRTEAGQEKADPLVKRIAGESGEQLLMQDGILYARNRDGGGFEKVSDDSLWAEWNVAGLRDETLRQVQYIPLPAAQYDSMIRCEQLRNSLSFSQARDLAEDIVRRFSAVERLGQGTAAASDALVSRNDLLAFNLFSHNDALTLRLLSVDSGAEWFSKFMLSWTESVPAVCFDNTFVPEVNDTERLIGGNLYEDANFRLNLMIKLTFGQLVARNAELIQQGISVSEWGKDAEWARLWEDALMLVWYTERLDARNMPLFPANAADGSPQYIPEGEYFMMGDNRFNSLDMRHSYNERLAPLSAYDSYSALYVSNIAPQSVPVQDILGTAVLRIWPIDRFGVPGSAKRPG